jgi:hypothetical protein
VDEKDQNGDEDQAGIKDQIQITIVTLSVYVIKVLMLSVSMRERKLIRHPVDLDM